MAEERSEAIRLIETVFGQEWRVYNASLAKLLDSVNAAIIYQQICYWSTKTKSPDGWFYKTSVELTDETGISRKQQDTAIKKLLQLELIEKRKGMFHKRYFRLTRKILDYINVQKPKVNKDNASRRHCAIHKEQSAVIS